jgi:glutaredoxin 3
MMADDWLTIQNEIESHTFAVFSKSWCPHCKAAKALIAEKFPDADVSILE